MNPKSRVFQNTAIGLFVGALLLLLFGHFSGYELSIPWSVTTTAESEQVVVHSFQKGPFSFDFQANIYELAENFSAGPIQNKSLYNGLFLGLISLGICIVLAVSTYLSRVWFIGISGLFIFFVINLRLQEVGIFGFDERSSISVILLLLIYLLPTYLFHAFFDRVHFLLRLGLLIVLTGLVVLFSQVDPITLQGQLISGSYFGLVIVSLLFLLIIAEENVFAILFLITKSKGGKSNLIHFSIFSTVYLVFLGLYYGKKSGLMNIELTFFDPFILLAISSLVTLWTLKFKEDILKNILSLEYLRVLFIGLGIIVFSFLGLAFFRGNDPVYEGYHYFIIFCHLGFGVMFFLYILLNFINPLSNGFQVFKIAYKEQNFPYVSAKLGGLIAIVGFFLLSSKEPFLLYRAGHFNYLGAQLEENGEVPLAQEYYQEGTIYGHDNHFSNYKMAYHYLRNDNIREATYRFYRATLRYPSPHSFINHSGALAMEGESTPSLVTLQNGLRLFPKQEQLKNNIGITYLDLGEKERALNYLGSASGTKGWTNANLVNLWKVKTSLDSSEIQSDYEKGNLAVKTNILSNLLSNGYSTELPFDTTYFNGSYPLHKLAYLINASMYYTTLDLNKYLDPTLSGPVDEFMLQDAKHGLSISNYMRNDINKALQSHDLLKLESRSVFAGEYLHELGLMALEQHALPNALNFFEQAIEQGNEASRFAKVAALLEMKKLDEAIEWCEVLTKRDSSYFALASDLRALKTRTGLSEENKFTHLYYFYDQYSIPEISALIENRDSLFISSLWQKISKELLLADDYKRLSDYRDLLNPYLDSQEFKEYELLSALKRGVEITVNHPVSKALNISNDSLKKEELSEIAEQNAFNVPVTLAVINQLNKLSENLAYDASVRTYNLNRFSPKIIKAYIDQCLQMNLVEYATTPLNRLVELIPEDEYFSYVDEVNTRIEEIKESNSW